MDPTILLILVAAGGVWVWWRARCAHEERLRRRARERLLNDEGAGPELAQALRGIGSDPISPDELAAYAGVTTAEFVWNWATIDPQVVSAASFASGGGITSGLGFAQHLHDHFDVLAPAAKEGFLTRLLGYVGEQQAAGALVAQGHAVEVAATANQPVWDLMVDGHMANVKTVADIAWIKAETAAHPGVVYFVPEDAHGHAAGNIVHLVGLKHDVAKESLKESIAAAHGEGAAGGILRHLPWITIGFVTYRKVQAIQKGTDPLVALHHGAAEVVGRGGGVILGAKVGAAAGTLLGPVGTAVGAAAGAIVGAMLGSAVAENYKARPVRAALERLERALEEFGRTFEPSMEAVRGFLRAPFTRMKRSLSELEQNVSERKATLRWWIWPDFTTVLLDESAVCGREQLAKELAAVQKVDAILSAAERTGRYAPVGLLMANSPVVRELVGYDEAGLEKILNARRTVLHERKQLNPDLDTP